MVRIFIIRIIGRFVIEVFIFVGFFIIDSVVVFRRRIVRIVRLFGLRFPHPLLMRFGRRVVVRLFGFPHPLLMILMEPLLMIDVFGFLMNNAIMIVVLFGFLLMNDGVRLFGRRVRVWHRVDWLRIGSRVLCRVGSRIGRRKSSWIGRWIRSGKRSRIRSGIRSGIRCWFRSRCSSRGPRCRWCMCRIRCLVVMVRRCRHGIKITLRLSSLFVLSSRSSSSLLMISSML
mmetsp:Transcript_6220/g.6965  ORF Transcript_6220/g.6965 Transcript_6220/m.6965 type:complete len:229 (-) Transcript_6220:279-965(-)